MYDTATPYLASFVIIRKEGKIAFVLRTNTGWMNGYYGLPSGKVEKVESDKFTYKLYWKILNHLQKKHPECFTVPAVPLAIGIHKELINLNILIDLNISKKQLDSFFHFYCSTPEYKEKVESGVERVELK